MDNIIEQLGRLGLNEHPLIFIDDQGNVRAKTVIDVNTDIGDIEGERCYICEVDPDTPRLFYIDTDTVIDATRSNSVSSCIPYTSVEEESNVQIVSKYSNDGEVKCFFCTTKRVYPGDTLLLSIYTEAL